MRPAASWRWPIDKRKSGRASQAIRVYGRLLRYMKPYVRPLLVSVGAMLGIAGTTALSALLVKNVLDDIFINKDRAMLALVPLAILVVYLLKGVFRYVRGYVMNSVGVRIVRDIRNELYGHLHRMSMSYFTETPTGILMSRVTYDVAMLQSAITDALTGVVRDLFTMIGLAAVVVYRDPLLGTVALIGFPLAYYPMFHFGRRMKKASSKTQAQVGEITKLMQERISGVGLVKAFGAEEKELERFREENERLVGLFLKIQKVRALSQPVMEIIGAGAAALIIWLGGKQVIDGTMTTGDFFSFLAALFMMYEPMKHLNEVNNLIQSGLAAAERVFDVLDLTPEVKDAPDAVDLTECRGSVELRGVSFRYREEWVLRGIDLSVRQGERLAIVGTSGGGKSTLVNLIPRFYDVSEGQVLVDGRDVRTLTQKSLRRYISIVSQDTVLFNDTVRSNLCYGMDGVRDEDLGKAVEQAYAHDFIAALPKGFDTVIGERGTRLSGGQRQRLSIARAILKNAPILILDEATSSLDTESERLVQKALENLEGGKTSFVIAHRLSTVRDADRIIVLSGGGIAESGRHEELLALGGEYARLHALLVEDHAPPA